ncbi:hypothetical protein ppKF707_2934 [Metapseudomonas furukawaii]|nr:hypothetical protein ppKF707_2934 [Pseudomonas furukawaii]
MLAIVGALDVLAPFVADDPGLDADLGPVRLEHLGHQLGVGVVGALHGHGPEADLGALGHAGGLEQGLGLLRVVAGVLDGLVVGPLGRRHAVDGELAGALVDGVDDGLLVHRHVQGLAHFELVEGRAGDVVGDVAEVEARLAGHHQPGVGLQRGEVGGARVQGDLALAGLELLRAHRSVGVDGEDQVVDLHVLGLPVVLVAGEADLCVLLVALEHEGTGADGLLVDVGGLAGLEQLVGVLGGLDGGEVHRQVLDEGRVHLVEGEGHGQVIELFHLGDVRVQAHVGEVGELGGVRLAEGVLLVEHALEGEDHVIGIEVAARLEVRGGVELHAGAQVEDVALAVLADVPGAGQGGFHLGAAAFELGQPVEEGFRGGVEIGAGGVLARVEAGGAALGAEDQIVGGDADAGAEDHAGGEQGLERGFLTHANLVVLFLRMAARSGAVSRGRRGSGLMRAASWAVPLPVCHATLGSCASVAEVHRGDSSPRRWTVAELK